MTIQPQFRGIACVVAATAAFVANDTCMKLAIGDAPPLQVLVMRGVAASLMCLPLILYLGQGPMLRKALDPWVLLRCSGEIVAILCFIVALGHMAIADLTAITQTTPLLVLGAGALFWRDPLGAGRVVLIAIGIAGALMVAQPGASAASPYAFLGFGTAAGAAMRDIVSRKVDRAIPALIVTFATLVTVMLVAVAAMLISERPVWPTASGLGLVAAAGALLICAHFLIFLAYRLAPPRVVAPFSYCSTIWAVCSGAFVFGALPNGLALAGMVLILATGLVVVWLEGRSRVPANNGQVISS